MDSRRDFIKKASMLAAGMALPSSILKAMAINPAEGSTFWDAEHVVILMQENRSFDHSYGMLKGVRGFNDPRAIRLPNNNKVFLQTNPKGETFAPFRLDLKETNATWMSSLPHSWENQVDARNDGKYDQWLQAKPSGHEEYKEMPLTLGYYDREDIPFYYALADAFTVCDQNFCSSLTGTTPNRLYMWSGTIREKASFESKANVKNEDVDYERWAYWKSFPERLEEAGISWRIYQNEISLRSGLEGESDAWLSNFTDNSIEWFDQYKVKFAPEYHAYLHKVKDVIPVRIEELKAKISSLSGQDLEKAKRELSNLQSFLEILKVDIIEYTPENFEKLSSFQKNLHKKAFTNNRADADYRELVAIEYDDNGTKRSLEVPKGDVLYQFRKDVSEDKLPAVSWLVAPENFSDHPGAPWYGAWYVSEVMEILTKNPEIWKKTIFILAYDENDGYFDHVPPFVPPHHLKPDTGKVSSGIDTSVEHVNIEHEKQRKYKNPGKDARESPIGLGFRVPLVIASPWSRGGQVCSEVFDHTSMLQFLEKFVSKKFNKNVKEENISDWRRTVCGDLTSVFKPYNGEKMDTLEYVKKEPFLETIHAAKFKKLPNNYKALTSVEVMEANKFPEKSAWMPKQEKGIKRACALPYELYVEGKERDDKFEIIFKVGKQMFGEETVGCPFVVYYRENGEVKTRNYALKAGDIITDTWMLDSEKFKFEVYGPNGFYRAFKVNVQSNGFESKLWYQEGKDRKYNGNIDLQIKNISDKSLQVEVVDLAYKTGIKTIMLSKNEYKKVSLDLTQSHSWYDFLVRTKGSKEAGWHYAGHVETGKESFTDPQMGGLV